MRWAAIILAMLWSAPALAEIPRLVIITAIDVSDSINEQDFAIEMEGLARGVTHERFLAHLGDGVGLEVFTWSSLDVYDTVIPYVVIRDRQTALGVAALLRAQEFAGVRRYPAYATSGAVAQQQSSNSGMTDLSAALDEAARRAISRPADRRVANVLADGPDNLGEAAINARDRLAALGITINAVIFGDGVTQEDYFRAEVITGPGAFVEVAQSPADLIKALERKFWQDMIAGVQ